MKDTGFKLFSIKLLHFAVSIAMFFAAWLIFRYGKISAVKEVGYRYNFFITIGYTVLLLLFIRTYNAYLFGYSRIRAMIFAQFLAQLFSVAVIWIVVCISWNHFQNPLVLIALLIPQFVVDVAWTHLATGYYFKKNKPKKTILIYRNQLDRHRFGTIKGKPTQRLYQIAKEMQYDGSFNALKKDLEGYDAVFVAGVNSRCRNGILKYCKEQNVPGLFLPHVGDVIMQGAMHIQSFDSPVLYVNRKSLDPEYILVKRGFDVFASALGIVILSPVLLVTAIAIKAYDHGPAIYKQVRLTKDGKEFKIYKFRSMRVDAEKDGVARLSSGDNDDRITPIGKIVRKCRLDELPQLFNILKGAGDIIRTTKKDPYFMRVSAA